MYIEVSLGELLDKYSILEIKQDKIQDFQKLRDVAREIAVLRDKVAPYLDKVEKEYSLLKYINQIIWDMNDVYCNQTSFNGKPIMEENNARFRIKRWINEKGESRLREVKSYLGTKVWLNADACPAPQDVILFAQWQMLYYDNVFIVAKDADVKTYQEMIYKSGHQDKITVLNKDDGDTFNYKQINTSLVPAEFLNIMLNH